jgi:hypothetical protein
MKSKNQKEQILNYTIRDLKMEEICPNSIDNVILSIVDGVPIVDLPNNMPSDTFKRWLKGKGGVFSKDLKKYCKGNPCGKYILMEGGKDRSIIRIIDDNEIEIFESFNLVDGKVKDKPFMTLRVLSEGQDLKSTDRHIDEIPESDLPPTESETPNNMPPLAGEDSDSHSLALFPD